MLENKTADVSRLLWEYKLRASLKDSLWRILPSGCGWRLCISGRYDLEAEHSFSHRHWWQMQEEWKNYELEGVEPIANYHLLVEYQVRFLTSSAFLVAVCFHLMQYNLYLISFWKTFTVSLNIFTFQIHLIIREDNCGVKSLSESHWPPIQLILENEALLPKVESISLWCCIRAQNSLLMHILLCQIFHSHQVQ